jgi:regulator of cell morphogenesis and NO signaling
MQVDAEMTLNQIVVLRPEAVSVLNRYGMDTCCGGGLSLKEAARRHGVELEVLLEELGDEVPARQ